MLFYLHVITVQAHDYQSHIEKSDLQCPPRLVVVSHDNGIIDEAHLIAYGNVMPCRGKRMSAHLMDLIAAYYCYDINYPKQYQLLGLLQTELVCDNQNNFFQCMQFVKFMKLLSEI
jgi:hypothetical protein